MYCPRCGHQNDPDSRFCSNCGATLAREGEAPKEERSWRERLSSLIGTTRAARLTTAGIVVAIAVAVIAFFALQTDDDIPRDDYTVAADNLCVSAKREIVSDGNRALAAGVTGPNGYAAAIVPVIADWRLNYFNLEVPSDRVDEATDLNDALIELLIQTGGLARLPGGSSQALITQQAARVDAATQDVEDSVAALGLGDCEHLQVNAAPQ